MAPWNYSPPTPVLPREPVQRWRLVLAREALAPDAAGRELHAAWDRGLAGSGLPSRGSTPPCPRPGSRSRRRSASRSRARRSSWTCGCRAAARVARARGAAAMRCRPGGGCWRRTTCGWARRPLPGRVAASVYRAALAPDAWTAGGRARAAAGERSWRRTAPARAAQGRAIVCYDLRPFLDAIEVDARAGRWCQPPDGPPPRPGTGRGPARRDVVGIGRAGRHDARRRGPRPRAARPGGPAAARGAAARRRRRLGTRPGTRPARSLTVPADRPTTLPVRARDRPLGASPCPRRGRPAAATCSEDPCTQSSRPAGSSTASRSAPSSRSSCSTSSRASTSRWTACSSSPTAPRPPSGPPSSTARRSRPRSSAPPAATRSSPSSTGPRRAAASRRAIART